jgi:DICT domain-containing protein
MMDSLVNRIITYHPQFVYKCLLTCRSNSPSLLECLTSERKVDNEEAVSRIIQTFFKYEYYVIILIKGV